MWGAAIDNLRHLGTGENGFAHAKARVGEYVFGPDNKAVLYVLLWFESMRQ